MRFILQFFQRALLGLEDVYLDNFGCSNASFVCLRQKIGVFLIRRLSKSLLLPQVGRKVGIRLGDRSVSRLGEITERTGGAPGRGVTVLDTGHLKQLLGNRSRHDAGASGRRYQTHLHGAAFAGHLTRHCVRLADLVTPVTTSNGDDGELGEDDSTANRSGYLLRALDSQSNVTVAVSDGNESLYKVCFFSILSYVTS